MLLKDLSEIKTHDDFAKYIGVRTQLLTYILYKKKDNELYTSFEIPKKSGGHRVIDTPIPPLKFIQRKISKKINEHMSYIKEKNKINDKMSHGFIKDKSIITNAEVHRGKRHVINVDLEDFFPTLNFGRVRGFFNRNKHFKLNEDIATMIAQLTCYKNSLPQGAPTSPVIANLIGNILDINILKITKKYYLNYTRYVDDLTFSTNQNRVIIKEDDFLSDLEKTIIKSGFKINKSKSRIQYTDSRQTVTGLTVNKKINTKKEFHKNTRAMANSLYSKGYFYIDGEEGTIDQLNGRFTFINQIDWYNNRNKKNASKRDKEHVPYSNLNSREKEYQKFLFYKEFINNQPLLITEGKTDIAYLKGAFKKMSDYHPNLIEKIDEDKYTYKISFLNRWNDLDNEELKQNKWSYFFNLNKDGAAPLHKIIDLYIKSTKKEGTFPGYWKFFEEKEVIPTNPVIIIIDNDNELNPFLNKVPNEIFSFITKNKYRDILKVKRDEIMKEKRAAFIDNIKTDINEKGFAKLFGNLYLLTLLKEKNEGDVEMEDLFDSQDFWKFNLENSKGTTLSHELNVKDKARFSKYVVNNYQTINYNNFKSTLNNIDRIIDSYKTSIIGTNKTI